MVMEENGGRMGEDSNPMEPDPGKMFVGGLNNQTTADTLRRYFEQFGEIKECVVMRDSVTKRSRGFGFVRFTDSKSVDQVQQTSSPHTVDGKKVDPKRAIPKRPPAGQNQFKKVFVGGLPPDISVPELKQYFEVFGKVTEVLLMHDRNTKRLRGFGFITFESDAAGKHVCETGFHKVKGKNVECKRAQPKEVMMLQGKGRGFIDSDMDNEESEYGNQVIRTGMNNLNFAPFPYGRGYPNGVGSSPVGFGFPEWTINPQLYQHLASMMQYGRTRGGYPTAAAGYPPAPAPQGFINMPDHRRSASNQYYADYNGVQTMNGVRQLDAVPNDVPATNVVTTDSIIPQEYEHNPVLTQYGTQENNSVVTSPLTQSFTQTSSRPDLGGYLTTSSRTTLTHDHHIYANTPPSPQGLFGHGVPQITLRH